MVANQRSWLEIVGCSETIRSLTAAEERFFGYFQYGWGLFFCNTIEVFAAAHIDRVADDRRGGVDRFVELILG